jgi:hypothetical protein
MIPRCQFCGAFREKDAQDCIRDTKIAERDAMVQQFKPVPCLRLMPYCQPPNPPRTNQ